MTDHVNAEPPAAVGPHDDRPTPELPVKGTTLLRAVEVMDALCAADGDAWARRQTHASLARYLLEETHEVLEVIARSDTLGPDALADELGDLLFQVLFHARVAENGAAPFDIDAVAQAFVDKMERRNPHVFGPDRQHALADREDVEQIVAQWHRVKAEEKAARSNDAPATVDGEVTGPDWFRSIPDALPSLQAAAKVVHRARSEGRLDELLEAADAAAAAPDGTDWGAARARALLDLAVAAEAEDTDPESALRTLLHRTRERIT